MSRRSLTSGEIEIAQSIFGDSIDYSAVRVYDRGYAFLNAIGDMSFTGNIYLPDYYLDDFSVTSLREQRLFIHEMVHVWQVQNNVFNLLVEAVREGVKHRLKYEKAYPFLLEDGKDLLDYGFEQQAAIIEEYFLRKMGADAMDRCRMNGTPINRCLNTGDDTQALLKSVLKNFLEDPSYARSKNMPSPATRPRSQTPLIKPQLQPA